MRSIALAFCLSLLILSPTAYAHDGCCKCNRAGKRLLARIVSRLNKTHQCRVQTTCCGKSAKAAASLESTKATPEDAVEPDATARNGWTSLFDGKQMGEWKSTNFGGEGQIDIADGAIHCDFGQYMTGITHSGKGLPRNNYEIELEAMREDGSDFFCGLTFPVDKNHASFICGGWGGSVIGISSIDQMDASENSTTGYKAFNNKEWYKIRVRVTEGRLQCWIDDGLQVDEEVTADRLSTRIEMDRSQPLGIACFDTQAAYRNIRIRRVDEAAKE